MKTNLILIVAASICSGFVTMPARAGEPPVGTSFTYQGQLRENDLPVTGLGDLEFRLFNDGSSGAQIGTTQLHANVSIVNGLFTAELDFGAGAFNGYTRWLEVAVRSPAGSGEFITLSPRQSITATPYALQTRGLFVDGNRRVGIGTTAPGSSLQVVGGVRARGGAPGDFGDNDNGYAFSGGAGDDDSGMFSSADGQIEFHTNAIERMRVNASGNVGIGTTSPITKLHVNGDVGWGGTSTDLASSGQDGSGLYLEQRGGSSAKSTIRLQTSKSGDLANYSQFFIDPNVGFAFTTLGTGNGNVGIGTTAPQVRLQVEGGNDAEPTGGGYVQVGSETSNIALDDNAIMARANDAPSALFLNNDGGDVLIGGGLRVKQMTYFDSYNVQASLGGSHYLFGFDDSTRRHKENTKPLLDDFERLLDAQPVTYTRPGRPDRWEIGYIAEDMHDLGLTQLVHYDAEGQPNGYNYEKSLLYLVEIAKIQRTQLTEQKARLAAYEETLRAITNRMEVLERAAIRQ